MTVTETTSTASNRRFMKVVLRLVGKGTAPGGPRTDRSRTPGLAPRIQRPGNRAGFSSLAPCPLCGFLPGAGRAGRLLTALGHNGQDRHTEQRRLEREHELLEFRV